MWTVLKDRLHRVGVRHTFRLVASRSFFVIKNLRRSGLRRCGCCESLSLFIATSETDDGIRCVLCGANRRYEMLARFIRNEFAGDLSQMVVLELDPNSALRKVLAPSGRYIRTYFEKGTQLGAMDYRGAECQDITKLTFPDESIDLIVSSDVLEHVPDLEAAFTETARVLRIGGVHVFTVPNSGETAKRAFIDDDGTIVHLREPDYHLDPLSPQGILAFWSFGEDLPSLIPSAGLHVAIGVGPEGPENRIVWVARKLGPWDRRAGASRSKSPRMGGRGT